METIYFTIAGTRHHHGSDVKATDFCPITDGIACP